MSCSLARNHVSSYVVDGRWPQRWHGSLGAGRSRILVQSSVGKCPRLAVRFYRDVRCIRVRWLGGHDSSYAGGAMTWSIRGVPRVLIFIFFLDLSVEDFGGRCRCSEIFRDSFVIY